MNNTSTTIRRCTKCKDEKLRSQFTRSRSTSDGLHQWCKECLYQDNRDRYAQDPEKARNRTRQFRKSNPHYSPQYDRKRRAADPLKIRLDASCRRAHKKGVPSTSISSATMRAYWYGTGVDADRCYYTGEPLGPDYHLDHKYPLGREGTPGHVITNIVPCAPQVNDQKWRRTEEEYREWLSAKA